MITKNLIQKAKDLAYCQAKVNFAPFIEQIEFTNNQGQILAEKLNADPDIVLLGTLLMDCQLGLAQREGRIKDHVKMGVAISEELLMNDKDITQEERDKVISSVREHHGVPNFSSLESEIVCNADCYKFVSVEGFTKYLRYARAMEFDQVVKILRDKADEKWNALSLVEYKNSLQEEYRMVVEMLGKMH